MLVGKDVVKSAGRRGGGAAPLRRGRVARRFPRGVGGHDTADLPDLARVRQPGDVEHDGAQVGVGTRRKKLGALDVVVSPVRLEVLPFYRAHAVAQLAASDTP